MSSGGRLALYIDYYRIARFALIPRANGVKDIRANFYAQRPLTGGRCFSVHSVQTVETEKPDKCWNSLAGHSGNSGQLSLYGPLYTGARFIGPAPSGIGRISVISASTFPFSVQVVYSGEYGSSIL